ncbi:MAG: HD domain-containing phosphohydrolase [Planctomycetota bacterium]
MSSDKRVRIAVSELIPGAKCTSAVYDDDGRLLLSEGTVFSTAFQEGLERRGIDFVEVNDSDLDALLGVKAKRRPAPKKKRKERLPEGLQLRARHEGEPYSAKRQVRFERQIQEATKLLDNIGSRIDNLASAEADLLRNVPMGLAEMLIEDADQTIASMLDPTDNQLLSERCLRMSLLAMNTAMELQLSSDEVLQIGLAGLLHDMGLYLMPPRFRKLSKKFDADQQWQYEKHPLLSANAISRVASASDEVSLMILQVHERPDGSGFPKGVHANLLHPHTPILNLVDDYLSLTECFQDRSPIVPHDAIAELLQQGAHRGFYTSKVMRAFICHLTLFPIGSLVELSDGQIGRVIRRSDRQYDRPLIRVLTDDRDHLDDQPLMDGINYDEGPMVDLMKSDARIVRPLCVAASGQIRCSIPVVV